MSKIKKLEDRSIFELYGPDILTEDFGDYELIEFNVEKQHGKFLCLFRCKICGRTKKREVRHMRTGSFTRTHASCIMLVGEIDQKFINAYKGMRERCERPSSKRYNMYGARGIECRYPHLIDFYDDMYQSFLIHNRFYGGRNTSIDRIDVNGHYEPGNVKWSTLEEQANNMTTNVKLCAIEQESGIYHYFPSIAKAQRELNISKINDCIDNGKEKRGYKFQSLPDNSHLPRLFKHVKPPLFKPAFMIKDDEE